MTNETTRTDPSSPIQASPVELAARVVAASVGVSRVIVGIAGAPGAGKSTLSAELVAKLGDRAVVIEMDGFHLADVELDRRGLRDRKGAPETFDVGGLVALLRRLREERETTVYAPRFDRRLEEPIAGAVAVEPSTDIVLVEGNYLLLDEPGWRDVGGMLDETWYLAVPDEVRAERLVSRRQRYGDTPEHARRWVREVDQVNADRTAPSSGRADLVVMVTTTDAAPGWRA